AAARPVRVEEAGGAVQKVAANAGPVTWQTVVEPLEDASERLWRAWSVAGRLNGVLNTPEIRSAYNACLPAITAYSTWVGLHRGLYGQYLRLRESEAFEALPPARQRIIELALRE